jgi:hypothetical protein
MGSEYFQAAYGPHFFVKVQTPAVATIIQTSYTTSSLVYSSNASRQAPRPTIADPSRQRP